MSNMQRGTARYKMDGATVAVICSVTSIVSAILGFLLSYFTFQRNKKKDDVAEGQTKGVMASDLGYIKAGVDDLKRELSEQRKTVVDLGERVTRVEESAKQAHKRIDKIEEHPHG